MVISAVFTTFLWTSVIYASFTNVGKVELTMHLLKFEVRKFEKISDFL